MASVSNILLDKEILLESGTNELEVLVFDVADYTFGINVAKVREVLPTPTITSLARAHPSVRGVFKLRDHVIPCVSLSDHLGANSTGENAESTVILTEVNQQQTAFLVDAVERIHRLSWENVLAVPGLQSLAQCPVTALARCEDRLVEMLDFEKVLEDVTENLYATNAIANPLGLPREDLKIVLAEDSPTIRELIRTSLTNSGYTQLRFFENGAEAWKWIEARFAETGKVEEVADLIVSDVEMPQIDGFHLTKLIKGHPELKRVPVLLYSSIITADNHKKGQAVGADLQISKPDLHQLVELADKLISKAQGKDTGATDEAPAIRQEVTPEPAAAPRQATTVEPVAAAAPIPVRPPVNEPAPPSATPAAELPAPVSEPMVAAPKSLPSIDMTPKAWSTFHRELIDETGRLRSALDRVREGQYGGELLHGVARSLHTIKGVAQVISLHQLIHCTHLLESLVEGAREDRDRWPHDAMQSYIDWLSTLTGPAEIDDDDGAVAEFVTRLSPSSDEGSRVAAAGRRLEAELNGLLTATVS